MYYQAVIFDLFGTLVDNYPVKQSGSVLVEMADILSFPRQEFIALWTVRTWPMRASGEFVDLEACIEYIGHLVHRPVTREQVKAAAYLWHAFTHGLLHPRPQVLETLLALKKAHYKIGVISDCSVEVQLRWQNTSFAPVFDASILSCEVGLKKPDPRIYQLACNYLKVSPQDCLYVGDGSSHELTGASRVGMHSILMRVSEEEHFDTLRPDAEQWDGLAIDALQDVLKLVEL